MALLSLPYLQYYALPLVGTWVVIFYQAFRRWRSPLSKLPYPPGPPERSIISGNSSDIPSSEPWRAYVEFGKKYGSVIHFRAYRQHTIVINSYEDCVEFFEKRSNIYSDRPSITMVDMMGWTSFNAGFMPYGPEWRAHRRIYNQAFKPEAALNYRPTQTRKVNDFLYGLVNTPEDWENHSRTLSAAVIMSTMYDHDVAPKNDFFVDLAEVAVNGLKYTVLPGAMLANELPILRFLPTWFPGAGFKRIALEFRKSVLQMRDVPFASVEKKMKEGKVPNCIAAELLQNCKSNEEYGHIKGVAGTSYAAGADTTTASMNTFFCAMAMFPEVQAKAAREIDQVVGSGRLVNFDDWPSLPYIEALLREVWRWEPVFPFGVFRSAKSDDVYKGYYIPGGATVLYNTWAIAHDPTRYPNPGSFNPDRFFNENGELNDDQVAFPFGFGRRMCPGRHLASATVWLAMATVLQNFDIRKKRDAMGNEIPISGEQTNAFLRFPVHFECSITPRSAEAQHVIMDAVKHI